MSFSSTQNTSFTERLKACLKREPLLWSILALAFVLRIVGIHYGLPLTLVDDEPPFVLAALQMLQLHTVIPALHLDAFRSILYYPPYMAYVLLLPFAGTIGVLYLVSHLSFSLFTATLLTNLSPFFEIARLINVLLGTAMVYLTYRVTEAWIGSKSAATVSAFLMATSIIAEGLSMVGRHWLPTSFVFVCVCFILTRAALSDEKKIGYALVAAGLGMGISTILVFALIPIGLWFLLCSSLTFKEVSTSRRVWLSGFAFAALAIIPTLLYPLSQSFVGGVRVLHEAVTFSGILLAPYHALLLYAFSEPVLIAGFLLGFSALLLTKKRLAILIGVFFLLYVEILYTVGELEPRFLLPLVPLYALCGGYLFATLQKYKLAVPVMLLVLCIPLATAVRFSTLVYANDTRALARASILETRTPQDHILAFTRLATLPETKASVEALAQIDPTAVHKTDSAYETLNLTNVPQSLTLNSVTNDAFFAKLPSYVKANHYTYFWYEPDADQGDAARHAAFEALLAHATLVKEWHGLGDAYSFTGTSFTASFLPLLFTHATLGPDLYLYKLTS